MKKIYPIFLLSMLCASYSFSQPLAQEQIAIKRAELFADSLVRAFEYSDWNVYMNLSHAGAVKYYGGKKGYLEHVQRGRKVEQDKIEQNPSSIRVVQMLNDMDQWQAVVERKTDRTIDDKPSVLVTYLVGQSMDDGYTWTFFDVGMNTVENVIYMMPEVFPRLSIPEKKIVRK